MARLEKENAELRQQKSKLEEERKVLDGKLAGFPATSTVLALEKKTKKIRRRNKKLKAELEQISKYREEIPDLREQRKELRQKKKQLKKEIRKMNKRANQAILVVMFILAVVFISIASLGIVAVVYIFGFVASY